MYRYIPPSPPPHARYHYDIKPIGLVKRLPKSAGINAVRGARTVDIQDKTSSSADYMLVMIQVCRMGSGT